VGVRILVGTLDGGNGREAAVLYCSTSEHCFGPIFEDHDEADAFLEWAHARTPDVRRLPSEELEEAVDQFRNRKVSV